MTIGMNISGAEFGVVGGPHDGWPANGLNGYHYPTAEELKFYRDQGVTLVRLPFMWERMQATIDGALAQSEVALISRVLTDAGPLGLTIIVDCHNYGRHSGKIIGAADGPSYAQFAAFWKLLATALKGFPALLGYDLMNEPHDMGDDTRWPAAAQAAVNAIREGDTARTIYVEGDHWAGAHIWASTSNARLKINDPAGKLVYQAHQYFDQDSSGDYGKPYETEGASPTIGVDRLKGFVEWLKTNNFRGMIGEFGVPSNDPRWIAVGKNAIDYMNANGVDGTYWAAGAWWPTDYALYTVKPGSAPSAAFEMLKGYFPAAPASPNPVPTPQPSAPAADTLPRKLLLGLAETALAMAKSSMTRAQLTAAATKVRDGLL